MSSRWDTEQDVWEKHFNFTECVRSWFHAFVCANVSWKCLQILLHWRVRKELFTTVCKLTELKLTSVVLSCSLLDLWRFHLRKRYERFLQRDRKPRPGVVTAGRWGLANSQLKAALLRIQTPQCGVWCWFPYALTDRMMSCSQPWLLWQPCFGRWVYLC